MSEAGLRAADPIPIKNQKPDGGSGAEKPSAPTAKPARSGKPSPKAELVSKEAQLRALREQGAR